MECEVCGAENAEEYHLRQHRRNEDSYDEYTMTLCTGCYNLRVSQDWIDEIEPED